MDGRRTRVSEYRKPAHKSPPPTRWEPKTDTRRASVKSFQRSGLSHAAPRRARAADKVPASETTGSSDRNYRTSSSCIEPLPSRRASRRSPIPVYRRATPTSAATVQATVAAQPDSAELTSPTNDTTVTQRPANVKGHADRAEPEEPLPTSLVKTAPCCHLAQVTWHTIPYGEVCPLRRLWPPTLPKTAQETHRWGPSPRGAALWTARHASHVRAARAHGWHQSAAAVPRGAGGSPRRTPWSRSPRSPRSGRPHNA